MTALPLFYLPGTNTTISVHFNSSYLSFRQYLRKDCQASSSPQSLSRQLSNADSSDSNIFCVIRILPLTNISFFKSLYIFSTSSAVGEFIKYSANRLIVSMHNSIFYLYVWLYLLIPLISSTIEFLSLYSSYPYRKPHSYDLFCYGYRL